MVVSGKYICEEKPARISVEHAAFFGVSLGLVEALGCGPGHLCVEVLRLGLIDRDAALSKSSAVALPDRVRRVSALRKLIRLGALSGAERAYGRGHAAPDLLEVRWGRDTLVVWVLRLQATVEALSCAV